MKILHLSTSDLFGGAARSAYRLHEGLQEIGVDSRMLVARRASHDETVTVIHPSRNVFHRALRRMRRWQEDREMAPYRATRPEGFEPFHTDRSRFVFEISDLSLSADLVNLHWVSEFVDYVSLLPRIAASQPIVWTLHDMNVFTGGCHYDHQCGQYQANCGACPQLGSKLPDDLSRKVWLRKQRTFSRIAPSRMHIVTPSQWLKTAAEASPLLAKFKISVIPYGLDTETFRPRDKVDARRQLGLPTNATIILFVAHSSDIRRKGYDLLIQALADLKHIPGLLLLTIGEGQNIEKIGIPEIRLGRVEADERLAQAYAAADVFVIPSREDNLPNTVLESLACGTPVVGFAVGGISEMVRDGFTGKLAATEDSAALHGALSDFLDHPGRWLEMSVNCRQETLSKYSLESQAQQYRQLYESLVPRFK